jgi:hypothetical protein
MVRVKRWMEPYVNEEFCSRERRGEAVRMRLLAGSELGSDAVRQ